MDKFCTNAALTLQYFNYLIRKTCTEQDSLVDCVDTKFFEITATLPLKDGRWVWTPHALSLHVKSLSVWIIAIRVTFPATAVQYCADDRIRHSPRFIMTYEQRMCGWCWWYKTCAHYITHFKLPITDSNIVTGI